MEGNDVVIEAFTELAPSYEETVDQELRQYWGRSYEEFVAQLVESAPVSEGDVVLDVATGTALIPLNLVGKVGDSGQVVGLDITPAMLKRGLANIQASGLNPRIKLICASAMDMPFVEGVFDTVICGLGTHHMDVPRLLSEIRRILKAEGNLFMTDVGASAFWRSPWGLALLKLLLAIYRLTNRNSVRAQAEVDAFPNVRTADEWRAVLSDFGFTKIEITESPARRRWYPNSLTMRAVAESV